MPTVNYNILFTSNVAEVFAPIDGAVASATVGIQGLTQNVTACLDQVNQFGQATQVVDSFGESLANIEAPALTLNNDLSNITESIDSVTEAVNTCTAVIPYMEEQLSAATIEPIHQNEILADTIGDVTEAVNSCTAVIPYMQEQLHETAAAAEEAGETLDDANEAIEETGTASTRSSIGLNSFLGIISSLSRLLPDAIQKQVAYGITIVKLGAPVLTVVKNLVLYRKATTTATVAVRALTVANKFLQSSLGVFAIASVAITAVTVALAKFNSINKTAERAVSSLSSKIGVEKRQLNDLFDALKRTNPESDRRKEILDEINQRYPDLLKNLDLEKASEQEIEVARRQANDELERTIFLQGYKEKYQESIANLTEKEQKVWEKLFGKGYTEAQINEAMDAIEDAVKNTTLDLGNIQRGYIDRQAFIGQTLRGTAFSNPNNGAVKDFYLWDELVQMLYRDRKTLDKLRGFGQGRLGIDVDAPWMKASFAPEEPKEDGKTGEGTSDGKTGDGKLGVKPPKIESFSSSEGSTRGGDVRNYDIKINKLVETITLNVTNLQEGKEQIRKAVAEALSTAVNDINLLQ